MTEQGEILTKELKIAHWGHGEWVDEPDTFLFEHLGFRCLGRRFAAWEGTNNDCLFGGYWCGYIEIREGHPWYMQDRVELDIDCHYGVSFSEYSETDKVHLIGFDCAHSGDYMPSFEKFMKENTSEGTLELKEKKKGLLESFPESHILHQWANPTYRNMEYVIEQCKLMAEQAKEEAEKKE